EVLVPDWQGADAFAGGGEDRVAQRWRKRRDRRFARAAPEIAARRQQGLDLGRVGNTQHFITVEVRLLDAAVLDGDFADQRRGQRVNDGALGLHLDRQRIDHMAAIERRDDAMHANFAALDRRFHYLRADTAARLGHGDAAPYALRQRAEPIGFFRRRIEYRQVRLIVAQQTTAVEVRIHARRMRHLVDE